MKLCLLRKTFPTNKNTQGDTSEGTSNEEEAYSLGEDDNNSEGETELEKCSGDTAWQCMRLLNGWFLSDEGPMLETLDYTIRIGSTPTFLYFDLNGYLLPNKTENPSHPGK